MARTSTEKADIFEKWSLVRESVGKILVTRGNPEMR